MGAWGTGVFDDDVAADVRDDWREAILDGLDPEAATAHVLERHRDALDDEDDAIVVQLALAAAQHETGRLQPDLRDAALALIEAGGDVARWAEEDDAAARCRAKALERLAAKLRGPQPAPKRLRRTHALGMWFDAGDVVLVRNPEEGAEALFVVVAHAHGHPRGAVDPVVVPFLWDGDHPPSTEELAILPPLVDEVRARQIEPIHRQVMTTTRADLFGPEIGEVVARGVLRRELVPREVRSMTSWPALREWVGGAWHRRCVEMTRRLAT